MIFKLKANVEFEAKNINDAFKVLSDYYAKIDEEGLEIESIFLCGNIEIKKLEEEEK